jgi:hypothetical protein
MTKGLENEASRNKGTNSSLFTSKTLTLFLGLVVGISSLMVLLCYLVVPDKAQVVPPTKGEYVKLVGRTCHHDENGLALSNPVENCWAHRFIFHTKLSQYFSLDMIIHRLNNEELQEIMNRPLRMKVTWKGQHNFRDDDSPWFDIAAEDITREITCDADSVDCRETIVFRSTSISYQAYYFQVVLLDDVEDIKFIDSISFSFTYGNPSWGLFSMFTRFVFSIVACVNYFNFTSALKKLRKNNRSLEQRWTQVLLFALIFYNNPFIPLEYLAPRHTVAWVGTIFQITFLTLILTFWISILDSLRFEPPFKFVSFYLPKVFFMIAFWLVGTILYTIIERSTWYDPLYNWYQDTSMATSVDAYYFIFGAIYGIWILRIVTYDECMILKNMNARQKILFQYHMFVITVTMVIGIVYSNISTVEHHKTIASLAFMLPFIIFNGYIYSLSIVFTPCTSERNLARISNLASTSSSTTTTRDKSSSSMYDASLSLSSNIASSESIGDDANTLGDMEMICFNGLLDFKEEESNSMLTTTTSAV